ncbi:MAG TPA: hypothetical protein EYP19_01980 [Desulfobacterales bacterium]|nr:hypothetical protein [Desulfobacterales bacterium]
MSEKYIYEGRSVDAISAAGVKGILIRSGSEYFLRVYGDGSTFIDYEIRHDDLSVTIDSDELAAFYSDGEHHTLDHSPSVFDLKKAADNDK